MCAIDDFAEIDVRISQVKGARDNPNRKILQTVMQAKGRETAFYQGHTFGGDIKDRSLCNAPPKPRATGSHVRSEIAR